MLGGGVLARGLTALLVSLNACTSAPPPEGLEHLRAPAGVMVQHQVVTYPVTGADKQTMRPQIRVPDGTPGATGYAGYYAYTIRWRYQTRNENGFCAIGRATVSLDGTVTIPEWTPPPGVDSQLVADWHRFRKALATHEQGHRALAYAGAGRVLRAIENLPTQACGTIGDAVRRAAEPLLADLKRQQADYDRETRHGILQGTRF